MGAEDRQSLLRTVYGCQSCPESFGFSQPVAGRPCFKFPPTIGASGKADLLFVGINPRRAGNLALHDALMADIGAFEGLARNWDGRQAYIAASGPEPHYWSHVQVVEVVFGVGAKFEDHAPVTELFFCASADSTGLPPVRSECADRYFETVLRPGGFVPLLDQSRLSTGAGLCHESDMAKPKKNAAVVALGRLGGLKGGKARLRKLNPKERAATAK